MTRRERFVNNASTTLNGGINAVVTTVTATDGSVFPTEGDYRIRVSDSEVMLVTARSTNVLTVERGVDGTTAVTHADGAECKAVVTATALQTYIDEATAGASSRKPFRLLDASGNVLTTADFTGVNMGTATVSDDPWGGITLKDPETDTQYSLQVKSAPATPYTITAHLLMGPGAFYGASGSIFGILFRESSTGEFILNYAETGDQSHFAKFDSPSVFNSFLAGELAVDFDVDQAWFQIEDDGATLYVRQSTDGINFFEIGSEGRTAFMAGGPDQIGFALNSRGDANKLLHLRSWIEE